MLKRFSFLCCFLFSVFIHACAQNRENAPPEKNGPAQTVCLNMIVKDESPVIKRSLSSVKNMIDYWVIVDTGSTDGTQQIIKEFMKDIPGELHERPWVNFEHNRNEALALAKNKGDYVLFIDADEQLEFSQAFLRPFLDQDCYLISVRQEFSDILRVFLVKNSMNWTWKGVLHEELICPQASTIGMLKGVAISALFQDGHRAQDPKKHLKDAQTLEEALRKDPSNARYTIFLAQSYLCGKDYPSALKAFIKRAAMGGNEEEVFWSLYQIGCIREILGAPSNEIIDCYSKAYAFRPSRAEPLFRLANHYYETDHFLLGYCVAQLGLSISYPNDLIYVQRPIYDYLLLFVTANCAHRLGRYEEAATLYKKILSMKNLPAEMQKETAFNLSINEQCLRIH